MMHLLLATIARVACAPSAIAGGPLFTLYREADRAAQLAHMAVIVAIHNGGQERDRLERVYARLSARARRRMARWHEEVV